jgi:hypothetical protein
VLIDSDILVVVELTSVVDSNVVVVVEIVVNSGLAENIRLELSITRIEKLRNISEKQKGKELKFLKTNVEFGIILSSLKLKLSKSKGIFSIGINSSLLTFELLKSEKFNSVKFEKLLQIISFSLNWHVVSLRNACFVFSNKIIEIIK